MFFRSCLKNALDAIEASQLVLEETILPSKCPYVENSTYRSGYDWLFWYERKLARFLEPWLKAFRHELIGEKGILCEALSNAFCHGHKKEPTLSIDVKVFLGKKGLLVQIKDQGEGFDVQTALERYVRGKAYYHIAGNGMRTMIESPNFAVFYEQSGSQFNLLRMFNGEMAHIPLLNPYRVKNDNTDDKPADTPTSVNDELTSNYRAIAPPKTQPRVKAAVLGDPQGRTILSFGIDEEKARALFCQCGLLFGSAQRICSMISVGYPESVWIQSSSGAILASLVPEHSRLLLMILDEDATPAQAKFYQPHIVEHLTDHLLTP